MNKEYCKQVDKLIPLAEAYAKKKCKDKGVTTKAMAGKDGKTFNFDFESLYFHQAMNNLCRHDGVRSI